MNSAFPTPTQLDISSHENMFLHFWNKGYRRIIGIVPPNAPLLPQSSLALRIRVKPEADGRGKAPGLLRFDGLWEGVDFTKIESTIHDLDKWQRWGCGVGLKTGRGFLLIDADTLNLRNSKIIETAVQEEIGTLPIRIGQYPKIGYLVRVEGEFKYRRVEFGKLLPDKKGNLVVRQDRVEILSDGRQFVAWGTHPKTMLPYSWPNGIPNFDEIPFTDESKLVALLNRLHAELPNSHVTKPEGSTEGAPDQKTLLGDPETVRRIVSALPNTSDRFGSREDYLRVGYAIKAAMGPEREYEAQELFEDWALRWDDPEGNDPDVVRADWNRLVPPFRVGASWLYEAARQASGGALDVWMDGEDGTAVEDALFPPEEGTREALEASGEYRDEYRLMTISDVLAQPDPKYLIDRHVPERGVGILFGAPGTGKSFITLDASLSLAFGFTSWQGDPINASEPVSVVYLAGEGAPGYKPRMMAWLQARGIPLESAETGRFRLVDESVDFMKPEDITKLVRSIKAQTNSRVALVVVDTVSTVIPGADENLQKDMSLFVRACRHIEKKFECAVWGVHHTNKAGEMRGSSVFEGGGDFIFRLDRRKGERVGRLYCHKMKDGGADGWEQPYRFDVVEIVGTANPQGLALTSLTVDRVTSSEAARTGGLTPEKVGAVFEAIQAAVESGEPWSMRHNVKGGERFYQTRMLTDFDIDRSASEAAMQTWLSEGRIADGVANKKSKQKGLYVTGKITVKEPSVFD